MTTASDVKTNKIFILTTSIKLHKWHWQLHK